MLTPIDALTIINRLNAEGEDPAVPYVAFSYNVTNTSGVPIVGSSVQIGQTFVSMFPYKMFARIRQIPYRSQRSPLQFGKWNVTASQDLGVSNLNVVSYVHPTTFFSGIRFDAEFGVGREGGQGGGIQIAGALSPTVSDGQFFSLTTASGTKTFEYDITGTPAVTSGESPFPSQRL